MNNELYIRRRGKILVNPSDEPGALSPQHLHALRANLKGLGYRLSADAEQAIATLQLKDARAFYEDTIGALHRLVGAHVKYRPMYPNFPWQVEKASDQELRINSMMHYFGDLIGARIMPKYEVEQRQPLADRTKLKVLELGNQADFDSIFCMLLQAKSAWSETDTADVRWFIGTYTDETLTNMLPEAIPNKENMASILVAMRERTLFATLVKQYAQTATDVLRIAVAVSGGDVSLAAPTKFGRLSRPERRLLLGVLEKASNSTEDMCRRPEVWKRLGERLHPGEYRHRFPKTMQAFTIIREDLPVVTFAGQVERAIQEQDVHAALELLVTRPGELARRMDNLLRTMHNSPAILTALEEVAPQVSSPVLLQLMAHMQHRNEPRDIRVFFPKGSVSKLAAVANTLPVVPEADRQAVVSICREALIKRYKALPPLGKVYLDEGLRSFTVPFATRSTSRALKTVGRGSRFKLGKGPVVRFFIWWKDGTERTDIDLSALGLDENSNFKMQITYYNLKELGSAHSGDITSAPKGASEFIDLDIAKALEAGVRYIVMTVHSYTQQPFYELPECFAGFMLREAPKSGEVYEPRTVQNKIDLTADTQICMPMILDLQTREVIWTDIATKGRPSHNNNVLNSMSSLTIMNKAMLSLAKPNLYDLFALHVAARGERVATQKEAHTIFAEQAGITPYDTDIIVGEYL
ncbi:MAG TPA: TerD family protein [Candidatus Saccharimonadales bacterium]|nr:TerD family protein [Candidatus Saccharimonadales bacterium]